MKFKKFSLLKSYLWIFQENIKNCETIKIFIKGPNLWKFCQKCVYDFSGKNPKNSIFFFEFSGVFKKTCLALKSAKMTCRFPSKTAAFYHDKWHVIF